MPTEQLEEKLQQWVEASVIDAASAQRIRAFEQSSEGPVEPPHKLRWPVLLAVAFGAVMIAAGILLFVAAHWDELSPAQRFCLVLAMVAGCHLAAGAVMPKADISRGQNGDRASGEAPASGSGMRSLGIALHGVGTVALGAGIFLAGQIFNLQEHWPTGILLWAVGAVLGWAVLRDWVQATLVMLLAPAWIASEWGVRAEMFSGAEIYLTEFFAVLAFAYLGAVGRGKDSEFRQALAWIGGLALLPMLASIVVLGHWHNVYPMPTALRVNAILMTFALPLLLAWLLRGTGAVWVAGFAGWVALLAQLDINDFAQNLATYALFALASIALVFWGLREQRRERVDLGVAGFAITIVAFYFSTMMDKLGRSASLVGFGLLFLLGGWKLEQLRRRLVAGMSSVRRASLSKQGGTAGGGDRGGQA